jgi:CubicO group peptidase (beta-lactamase class C family)
MRALWLSAGIGLISTLASGVPDPPAPGYNAMDAAVRNGDFKKITSVLVARDGKIIHETYFNGADAATLHNTRSCTKTITGALIGIAIDRKIIPSVQATVLPYFPDRQPLQNPDPRKDKIQAGGRAYRSFSMSGTGGNHIHVFPEQNMVVVLTTSRTSC